MIIDWAEVNGGECLSRTTTARDKQVAGAHYKEMGGVVDTWSREQRIGAYRHGVLNWLMLGGSNEEGAQYMEKLLEVLREQ